MVALQFIKAALPNAQIDWIVEQGFAEVLADNPDIRSILTVNLKALKTDKKLLFREFSKVKQFHQNQYDLVIDAQGLIKSALVARLLSKQNAGFDKNSIREKWAAWFYQQTVACPYDANTIDRNVKVLTQPLGIEVNQQQILNKKPFLFFKPASVSLDEYFQPDQPNILLVIGSTWPSRNYPKQQFLQLIQALPANYLICWGNAQEHQDGQWLAERCEARLLPRLNLNDLKAAIARVDLLIGNDTGPTHMAWGLNRPSITLFGPTPISRIYQTDINKLLKSPSSVNPFKLDKNDFSIAQIPVQDVVDLAKSLLARG
jgi:heptosyltransferase-1